MKNHLLDSFSGTNRMFSTTEAVREIFRFKTKPIKITVIIMDVMSKSQLHEHSRVI